MFFNQNQNSEYKILQHYSHEFIFQPRKARFIKFTFFQSWPHKYCLLKDTYFISEYVFSSLFYSPNKLRGLTKVIIQRNLQHHQGLTLSRIMQSYRFPDVIPENLGGGKLNSTVGIDLAIRCGGLQLNNNWVFRYPKRNFDG